MLGNACLLYLQLSSRRHFILYQRVSFISSQFLHSLFFYIPVNINIKKHKVTDLCNLAYNRVFRSSFFFFADIFYHKSRNKQKKLFVLQPTHMNHYARIRVVDIFGVYHSGHVCYKENQRD